MQRDNILQTVILVLLLIMLEACQGKRIREEVDRELQANEDVESPEDYLEKDFSILLKDYEDPGREMWQNPDLVVEKMGDLNGKTVADIGVGTGYFTFKIAYEASHVIAIDVESKFLEYIEERKFELQGAPVVGKIETRLCEPDDPSLNKEEANLALMVDTYHFLNDRVGYMKKVYTGLKSEGVVLLVDYKKGDMPVGPPDEIKVDLQSAMTELRNAGFSITEVDTSSLEFQYIIKATKKL